LRNIVVASAALISGDQYYVPDTALTASSFYWWGYIIHEPKCSRIGVPRPVGCSGDAWCVASSLWTGWIQVIYYGPILNFFSANFDIVFLHPPIPSSGEH